MMAPRGIVVLTVAQFFGGLFLNDNMKMASYITPVNIWFSIYYRSYIWF